MSLKTPSRFIYLKINCASYALGLKTENVQKPLHPHVPNIFADSKWFLHCWYDLADGSAHAPGYHSFLTYLGCIHTTESKARGPLCAQNKQTHLRCPSRFRILIVLHAKSFIHSFIYWSGKGSSHKPPTQKLLFLEHGPRGLQLFGQMFRWDWFNLFGHLDVDTCTASHHFWWKATGILQRAFYRAI